LDFERLLFSFFSFRGDLSLLGEGDRDLSDFLAFFGILVGKEKT
jgi:hypothetical protein